MVQKTHNCFSKDSATFTLLMKHQGLVYILIDVLFTQDSSFVLKVAGERFRMLQRDELLTTEKVPNGEYLDRLVLRNVQTQDSGMYICFVTSNGIGQLTYKAVFLNVVAGERTLVIHPIHFGFNHF